MHQTLVQRHFVYAILFIIDAYHIVVDLPNNSFKHNRLRVWRENETEIEQKCIAIV